MSVKIVYKDIAVGADDDASISSTAAQSFSQVSSLAHGAPTPELSTLELNAWLLNKKKKIITDEKVGFWSEEMSDENCSFSPESPPILTVLFDEQYTSLGISLVFNPVSGDYCPSITVRWYQSGTLLAEQDFSPNSTEYFCQKTVEHYNRVDIQLNKTNLPYRYAKLSKVLFGITRIFLRDELKSVQITEAIDPISSELSINKMNFSLESRQEIDYIFQQLQPIYAYNGDVLIGAFYIESSSRTGKAAYDISCNDAIGILDNETVPAAMYTNKNVRELIEEILDGKFELELAEELEDETVTGYLPRGTKRNALHQIAFAIRAVVDTSGTEAIKVFRPQMLDSKIIPPERTYIGSSVSRSAIVTAVKVTSHSYSTSGSGDPIEVNGTTYYDTKTVTTINNPNITASDKQNVIEITDATLVTPANVSAVAQHVYDYYMRRNVNRTKIVVNDESPGDYVTTSLPWGGTITGTITTMNMTLSGIVAADCEVTGI